MGYNPTASWFEPQRPADLAVIGAGTALVQFFFDGFAGFARGLLDAADQFLCLAFGVLEVVIRQLGPFLFELALGDVPVAFDFECIHNCYLCGVWFVCRRRGGKISSLRRMD